MCGMFDWIVIDPRCRVGALSKYTGDRDNLQTKSFGSWLDTFIVTSTGELVKYEHDDAFGSSILPPQKRVRPVYMLEFTGWVTISCSSLSMYFENGILMDAENE